MLLSCEVQNETVLNVNLNKSKTVFIIPFTLKEDYKQLHETIINSDWDFPIRFQGQLNMIPLSYNHTVAYI
ncbi:hypothetical protein [Neobacillus bataviensis]|uniref:hypothetical protein n=1 Tax=Neobacillus bataviensis TaxID=220685 RepID=UPI001CBE5406|nr:hypothetical protein [Neobacillus bataviensis]